MEGEYVLGTGFLSALGANLADITGSNSTMYGEKLRKAKEASVNELEKTAVSLGANAIIGVDVDYNVFMNDVIAVAANGTAVMIEPIESESGLQKPKKLPIYNYSPDIFIRPYEAVLDNNGLFCFSFYNYKRNVTAINIDLSIFTLFDDIIKIENLSFTSLAGEEDLIHTDFCRCESLAGVCGAAKFVHIHVRRFIIDDKIFVCPDTDISVPSETVLKLRNLYGNDVFCEFFENDRDWQCFCGKTNALNIPACPVCGRVRNQENGKDINYVSALNKFQQFSSAREIYDYINNYNRENQSGFSEEIVNIAKKHMVTEKLYGNSKEDCLKMIQRAITAFH